MKNILTFIVIGCTFYLSGQNYWQQEVNYTIKVELDDKQHVLKGHETFEYINHSPHTLSFIYIHLWPNAYADGSTALANQLYQDGNDLLKFVTEEKRGYIDSLNFTSLGVSLNWEYDKEHKDIAKINLSKPLLPGEKVTISTPFKVKLPTGDISRLGHIDQSYQITQWYPKPAVFDHEGWHQMPYLNQGEFYSEYGSYDVEITLPENYVVGATGDLQTEKEQEFLAKKVAETEEKLAHFTENTKLLKEANDFPLSSEKFKTIRYTQSKVHDFAWFADKRFEVLQGEVELPHSKRIVTTWAMFVPNSIKLWKDALEYLNDGTYYYSLWNGDYPYNQVTAVDGTISAGGGMEYPNVTVIGTTHDAHELEVVIVHEVGHNWFYGILGSNERVNGWMDEGLNTLNEVRYIQTKYPDNTKLADMILNGKFNFHGLCYHDLNDISYRMVAALAIDQPIQTHSADFRSLNYGVIMYQKTGLVFDYLKYYLGEELFDQAMRTYYDEWKFKHPQPNDIRSSIEKTTQQDLSWLFEDLIQTTNHIDYKISRVKFEDNQTRIKVKNKGNVFGPIPVSVFDSSGVQKTEWLSAGLKKGWLTFEGIYTQAEIDPLRQLPEVNRQNNTWNKKQLFNSLEPLQLRMLSGYNRSTETNHFVLPLVLGNAHDKLMLGAAFHNYGIAIHPFRYFVAPMYSFGRQFVSGIGEFSYSFYPKGAVKQTQVGLSLKSFKDDMNVAGNGSYFAVASPYTSILFSNDKKHNPVEHTFVLQGLLKKSQRVLSADFETGGFINYKINYKERDHVVKTSIRNDVVFSHNSSDKMARLFFDGTYRWRYKKQNFSRWLEVRLFAGYSYLSETSTASNAYRYGMSLGGADGLQDIFVEEYFLNRGATAGLFMNQRQENMGGFKTTSTFGTTNSWLTTATLFWELPIRINGLGLFADLGAFEQNGLTYGVVNSGIGFRIKSIFGIYFPVFATQNLVNAYNSANYLDRIRFTLTLNLVNTGKIRSLLML
jgi:hypothetical protein